MKLNEILDIYKAEETLSYLPSREDVGAGLRAPIIPFVKFSSYDKAFGISDVETHKRLKTSPVEELKIADLVTWQDWISPSAVLSIMKAIKAGNLKDDDKDPVSVVSNAGKNVIIGGNHRITAMLLTGAKTVKARHLTLDEKI